MKIIIHAGKDEMILAVRAAQKGLGHDERGEWPACGWITADYEDGSSFVVQRGLSSITVWSQQVRK